MYKRAVSAEKSTEPCLQYHIWPEGAMVREEVFFTRSKLQKLTHDWSNVKFYWIPSHKCLLASCFSGSISIIQLWSWRSFNFGT